PRNVRQLQDRLFLYRLRHVRMQNAQKSFPLFIEWHRRQFDQVKVAPHHRVVRQKSYSFIHMKFTAFEPSALEQIHIKVRNLSEFTQKIFGLDMLKSVLVQINLYSRSESILSHSCAQNMKRPRPFYIKS